MTVGMDVRTWLATRLATELSSHEAPRLVSGEASSAISPAILGATGDAAFRATPPEAPNHYPFKG